MLNNEQKTFLKKFFQVINSVMVGKPFTYYFEPRLDINDPKKCLIDHLSLSKFHLNQGMEGYFGAGVPKNHILKFIETLNDIDFEPNHKYEYDDYYIEHILGNCDYREITFTIDPVEGLITISDDITYTSESEEHEENHDFDDFFGDSDGTIDEKIIEYFDQLKGNGISRLTISFNGSGDSGYISTTSNQGEDIPNLISDHIEYHLSNNYGGWELNEGSGGDYIIDLEQSTVSFSITYYESNTIIRTFDSEKII